MSGARSIRVKLSQGRFEIVSPAVMAHTRSASVPHLTRDVFDGLVSTVQLIQIPLTSTHRMVKAVAAGGTGVGRFAGFADDRPTCVTVHDPAAKVPATHMEKYTVPLWTRAGKMALDADKYMDAIEAFKPDMYEVLHDGCTDKDSSKKRIQKSVDRSNHMFAQCIARHKSSDFLKSNSLIFAPIAGGYSIDQRNRSLDCILTEVSIIDGFVLDGFNNDYPNLEKLNYDEIKHIVEPITERLPIDKVRMARGSWNALTLLDLVLAGWDLFDTSMPYLVTERGSALTFSFRVGEENQVDNRYELNLKDPKYKEDLEPILKGCSCLTCTNHTRAYINHLLNTNELLSGVLLMIHNLHHYFEYFHTIRNYIISDKLHLLRSSIEKQYAERKVYSVIEPEKETNKKKARLVYSD